jgi:hypothetical protein
MLKRTCWQCKALDEDTLKCKLGYKNIYEYDKLQILKFVKPTEPCPKPKTYLDFRQEITKKMIK